MVTETQIQVHYRAASGRIEAFTPYEAKDAIKTVPGGRWDPTKKCWYWPTSETVAGSLRALGRDNKWKMLADTSFRGLITVSDEAYQAKSSVRLPQPPRRVYDSWKHQLQAYHFARKRQATMLDMSMGTGKSKVVVDLIQNGFEDSPGDQVMSTVIIAPNSVVAHVWPGEFEKHWAARDSKMPAVIAPAKGSITRKVTETTEAIRIAEVKSQPWVVVVNYEAFWQGDWLPFLLNLDPELVIFDEIHKIKAPGGKWSRAAARLGNKAPHRLGLTGTVMPHSPMDIYGQFRAIDPGVFGTSFVRFRQSYAMMGGYMNKQIVGYRNSDEMQQRLQSASYRATEDVLDLPEAMHEWVRLDLPGPAAKAYNDLETKFYAEVDGGEVTVTNALSKLLRLRQVTSGHLPTDDVDTGERSIKQVHDEKRKALIDLLDNVAEDEPVVVFAVFKHDLDEIHAAAEKLGRKSLELSGGRKELEEWKRGDAPILAVQIQSGGVGIDLTRARYCVYYSLGFSLGEYEQSIKRVHRPGQDRPVTYYYLLMERTVDIATMRALEQRKRVVEAILNKEVPNV